MFKVVLQTQFRCGWGPLRLLSLAQAKKNDQTFQQRQAIFFQKAALFQIAYKFQIKRVLRVQNRGKAQAVGAQDFQSVTKQSGLGRGQVGVCRAGRAQRFQSARVACKRQADSTCKCNTLKVE